MGDEGRRGRLIIAGKNLKLPAKADNTSKLSSCSMDRIAKDNDAQ